MSDFADVIDPSTIVEIKGTFSIGVAVFRDHPVSTIVEIKGTFSMDIPTRSATSDLQQQKLKEPSQYVQPTVDKDTSTIVEIKGTFSIGDVNSHTGVIYNSRN